MEVLNYESIKNEIEGFYKEKIKVERKIETEKEIKEVLTTIFGKTDSKVEIKELYSIELIGDISVLKYKTVSNENKKETEVIVLVKNDKPLFKLEHHKQKNNETEYIVDSYYTYEENSHYLISRINIETITNETFKISNVKTLNRSIMDTRAYYRKEYTFYINNGKILSIRTDDDMYLENESKFNNILPVAIKLIDRLSSRIITHLENITLDDNVKEYKIRRKNN